MKIIIFLALTLSTACSFAQVGVSTDIDPKRINEVSEWVDNAKFELDKGIEDISKLPIPEQENGYNDLIDKVLKLSNAKPNEFLMRNMLYRTQVVYKAIQNSSSSPKRDAYARRILEEGAKWALTLYEADQDLLHKIKTSKDPSEFKGVSFVNLGLRWADYVFNLYYSAPDNSSKFLLMKDMLGLLYNDINDDAAVKKILAAVSKKIISKHAELKNYDPKSLNEELEAARDLRRFIEQHISAIKNIISDYPDIYKNLIPFDAYNLRLEVLSSVMYKNIFPICEGMEFSEILFSRPLLSGMIIRILEPLKWGDKLDYNQPVRFRLEESSPKISDYAPLLPNCEGTLSLSSLIREGDYKLNDKYFRPVSEAVTFNSRHGIAKENVYLVDKKNLKPYDRKCLIIPQHTKLTVSSKDVKSLPFFMPDLLGVIESFISRKNKFIVSDIDPKQIYNFVEVVSDDPKLNGCKGYILRHYITMVE
ncbi:MAG: hypothetical protein V4596_03590 [Bdellovibrionota bacterium]